ncbi:MAG: ArdC family protein [Verrucomicrobiales bacterium]
MSAVPVTPSASSPTKANRPDPYQVVTDLIIAHLENGVVPWRCPWNRETGRPRNFQTGKPYRGVNVMLLGCRYAVSPWWLTFNQAKERGGQIRKGAKGAVIIKYGTTTTKEGQDPPPPAIEENTSEATLARKKGGRFLRTFVVFNASQIEGIAFPEATKPAQLTADQRLAEAERIVSQMPQRPVVKEGSGTRACYRPTIDEIEMPPFGSFESPEAFYNTLYHELVHSTGHSSRLNRETLTRHDPFGGEVYSQEELVAEMGAAFVGMEADIVRDQHEQSAAYLKSWLIVLKDQDHRRWIIQAAAQASRAADFILNRLEPSAPIPAAS